MDQLFFNELIIIFTASVAAIALLRPLKIPTTLAYLLVGCLIGPSALGLISSQTGIQALSEFGVVFLLFSLGLEFSLPKLIALSRSAFGLATAQVIFCSLGLYMILWAIGVDYLTALILTGILTLSSTAVITKELTIHKQINSRPGQLAIGVLLFQDLVAVFFLILISALGSGSQDLTITLVWTMGKGIAFFLAMLGIGKWLLPMIFHEIAKSKSEELFVLTALVIALLAAWMTQLLGLSMALGAFVTGMLLGESHYRHQVEADIRPFRDLLLGLFFVSIGMLIDANTLSAHWHWIILGSLGLIAFKLAVLTLLALLAGENKVVALRLGIMLAQGSEFGFALIALSVQHHLLNSVASGIIIPIIIISLALTPWLFRYNRTIAHYLFKFTPTRPEEDTARISRASHSLQQHVIICGYGRVGQAISRFLNHERIPYLALDSDPLRVREALTARENIQYGNASNLDILKAAGIEQARLIVISFDDYEVSLDILKKARALHKAIPILVRTRDDSRLTELISAGATEVIPEVLEASLMLVSHVLAMLDIPITKVLRTIQKVRKDRYHVLHGYFQGEQTHLMDIQGNPLKILHAVHLNEGANAVGKTIKELDLAKTEANVQAVHRKTNTLQTPIPSTQLHAEDIVILYGTGEQIEAAEALLLSGN